MSARVRRDAVDRLRAHGVSQRRACALMCVARSGLRYRSRLIARDAPIIDAMRRLSVRYPRYGYRRIRVFLKRQGYAMSVDRAHRLWRKAGLQVPRPRPRRRAARHGLRPIAPLAANHVWAYDFVHDACANGQQLKCLTIVDEWSHECLAIDVAGRIRSAHVIDVLRGLVSTHGAPCHLRSDNGPEFISRAVQGWIADAGIRTLLSEPGKPWQNGTDESFNGKFRDECLNAEWVRSRREAKVLIEAWRKHYNAVRLHSSLNYLTPNEFKTRMRTPIHLRAKS